MNPLHKKAFEGWYKSIHPATCVFPYSIFSRERDYKQYDDRVIRELWLAWNAGFKFKQKERSCDK
jgi:hypothetical protein